MRVVIVNGGKLNSYALAIEAANKYAKMSSEIKFVDLDIFNKYWSFKSCFQEDIFSKYVNLKKENYLVADYILFIKSAYRASKWLKSALKVALPWETIDNSTQVPLGKIVKSLIARSMGTSNFELQDCSNSQVLEIATKSLYAYFKTVKVLAESDNVIDLGIAHGGRDAYSAGAVVAFREYSVNVKLVEAGGIPANWSEFKTSPHFSPDFWEKLITAEKYGNAEYTDIAKWWAYRLKGSDHFRSEDWSASRTSGYIPSNIPEKYISFFTTSDFEIPVFDDFDIFPGEFSSQFSSLRELMQVCRSLNKHLVIRRHPNSVDRNGIDREIALWEEFKNVDGVSYIGPKEKVDSIALAQQSEKVFTFKSSVGIEAIWLGTSAFAMGPARWAYNDELRVWSVAKLKEVLMTDSNVNMQYGIIWATMMLSMDFKNEIFDEIHGNYALIGDVVIKNTKVAVNIEKIVMSGLRFSLLVF